ncbi:hypothetical protein ABVK25_005774 [Lepraria finkii]|uniref:Uncharacterized protein n=1 Tax=Lepraria finkii TaxID=1340010 RepID=A0ABR4B7W6_9LECA
MPDEYRHTLKNHGSGSKKTDKSKVAYQILHRTWPAKPNTSGQTETEQASTASTESTMQRWADEGMSEQPYNAVGTFRPFSYENGSGYGGGNGKSNETGKGDVGSTGAVRGSDHGGQRR